MIRSIEGSATRQFIEAGKSKLSGVNVPLAYTRLNQLNAASSLSALSPLNSVGLHKLKGDLGDFWSIDVNASWRIPFRFDEGNAYDVHIFDPH